MHVRACTDWQATGYSRRIIHRVPPLCAQRAAARITVKWDDINYPNPDSSLWSAASAWPSRERTRTVRRRRTSVKVDKVRREYADKTQSDHWGTEGGLIPCSTITFVTVCLLFIWWFHGSLIVPIELFSVIIIIMVYYYKLLWWKCSVSRLPSCPWTWIYCAFQKFLGLHQFHSVQTISWRINWKHDVVQGHGTVVQFNAFNTIYMHIYVCICLHICVLDMLIYLFYSSLFIYVAHMYLFIMF